MVRRGVFWIVILAACGWVLGLPDRVDDRRLRIDNLVVGSPRQDRSFVIGSPVLVAFELRGCRVGLDGRCRGRLDVQVEPPGPLGELGQLAGPFEYEKRSATTYLDHKLQCSVGWNPGQYELALKLTDQVSGAVVRQRIRFQVVPAP